MSWLHDKTTEFLSEVAEAKRQKAFPFLRPFENIGPRVKIGSGSYINFTSNDYLGLSQDPRLIRRAAAGVARFGTGLGSSRLQATATRHNVLEDRLARWLGFPACAVFTTGYQALVGLLSTYLDDDTTVALDKLSHAAIVDGVYMAQGMCPDLEVRYFKHNNVTALRKVLAQSDKPKKLVVVEGLYSVDGDFAPLDKVVEVCREYGAPLVVDDAHGLGAVGPTGRGTAEVKGVLRDVDLLFGTFSKAFGGVGGFILGDREIVDFLKLRGRSFVYSASLPIAQVEAALGALDIMERDHSYFRRLESNRDFFRAGLHELGFNLGDSETHITPIMVGDEIKALTFGAYLFHGASVIMMPFIYPGVPIGKSRLRCNVTAAHSRADMGYTLEALAAVGPMVGVIPKGRKTSSPMAQKALWAAESKLRGLRNAGLPFLLKELREAGGKAREAVLGKREPADPPAGPEEAAAPVQPPEGE
jgi:glycine C-acetyltransferase